MHASIILRNSSWGAVCPCSKPQLACKQHLPFRTHNSPHHITTYGLHHGTQQPCRQSRKRAAVLAAAVPQQQQSTAQPTNSDDWRSLLLTRSLEPGQLVKLTLKAKIKGDAGLVNIKPAAGAAPAAAEVTPEAGAVIALTGGAAITTEKNSMPYKQLTVRPVMIRGKVLLQASLLTARQDITKNFTESQAAAELGQLLHLPWSSASLVTLTESVTVQVSRKGKTLVQVKPNKQQQATAASSTTSSSNSTGVLPVQQPQQQEQQQLPELFGSSQQQQQQQQQPLVSLQHDRVKAVPINGSLADPFLFKIGLQTAEGRIKANMQAKFTQINEFLKLLVHSGELEQLAAHTSSSSSSVTGDTTSSSSGASSSSSSSSRPVHILDAGCGSSHLTFGTFHYLHNVMGLPVRLSGVDTNRALMQRSNRACADLGIADVAQFHTAAIREFPALKLPNPDIVLALHACDTATDEALAVGVLTSAQVIMSVPCCQKDIQRQYQRQQQQRQGSSSSGSEQQQVQQLFEPLMLHGILKQRQLDLLTDAFRAQLLRLAGYRTDVVEFVSTEHTPRNLLIRAVKRRKAVSDAGAIELAREYKQLRDAWGVRPQLEKLLKDSLPPAVVEVLTS